MKSQKRRANPMFLKIPDQTGTDVDRHGIVSSPAQRPMNGGAGTERHLPLGRLSSHQNADPNLGQ
jgi:hypothetical protein